jgi:hypothetical protein
MMRRVSLAAVTLAAGLVLASAARAEEWGTLKGRIVWGGNGMPEVVFHDVTKDQEHCLSKGKIAREEWVVNEKNKGLRWVLVSLAPDAGGKLAVHPSLKDIKGTVTMDQPCCKFEPHVVGVRAGQPLLVKNSAPIVHNVNWSGFRNKGDNKILPPGGKILIDDLNASPFPVNVGCNIHGWMKAYVGVFDHPYFTVTDENGNFEIKDAPAGNCRLVIWHEAEGWKDGNRNGDPVTIKANATTDVGAIALKPKQ